MTSLSRRAFLQHSATVAAGLTLARLQLGCRGPDGASEEAAPAALPEVPGYRGWEDVYRERWTWDAVVKGAQDASNRPLVRE